LTSGGRYGRVLFDHKINDCYAPVAQGIEHSAPDADQAFFQVPEIIDIYLISFDFRDFLFRSVSVYLCLFRSIFGTNMAQIFNKTGINRIRNRVTIIN